MTCLLHAARICVDAGHGGKDPGAVDGGVREKDLVLVYSDAVVTELRGRGHTVKMTRQDDTFVDLADRARIANDFDAEVFVSIHANASTNPEANGAWIIHHHASARGEALARRIAERYTAKVYPDRSSWTGGRGLAVLRATRMPAALIELGFLTNPLERKALGANPTQRYAARTIADGIEGWLRK